jgi:hypothetical protein
MENLLVIGIENLVFECEKKLWFTIKAYFVLEKLK